MSAADWSLNTNSHKYLIALTVPHDVSPWNRTSHKCYHSIMEIMVLSFTLTTEAHTDYTQQAADCHNLPMILISFSFKNSSLLGLLHEDSRARSSSPLNL